MSDEEERDPPEVPGHRLDTVIGAGASAVVWAGVDASGRRVAVKVPRDVVGWEHSTVEQQVLLAVRHEHLVTLRSVVPLADGREALVFDRVEGVALAAMVEARGHLRTGEIVTILTPLCDAVATLHRAGGLHGDISATNVTVTPDGRPVLLDLGAARLAGSADEQVWGTAGFVAPEVVAGAAPSEASDVYGLGALAWFCATGNGAPATMLRLDRDVVASHVGERLADAIGACIDPDPAERPSSDVVARLFYDAAPADAVEVVLGSDLASALTHRLRAQARDDTPPPELPGRRPRWVPSRGLASGSGSVLGSVTRVRLTRAARRPVVALAASAVVAVGVACWAVAARSGAGDVRSNVTGTVVVAGTTAGGASRSSTPTAVHPTRPAPVTTRAAPSADRAVDPALGAAALLRSPTAPADHAADLLQVLADGRTRALLDRNVAGLAAVHRTGGPSWASDREVVQTLRSTRTRWEGLRLEVATATYVPTAGAGEGVGPGTGAAGGPTPALVRARVDWTAYTAVTDAGARAVRAAEQGELLDFHLVRGAQGWRIESISRAPTS